MKSFCPMPVKDKKNTMKAKPRYKYRAFIDHDFQSHDNREEMLGQLEKEFGRARDDVRRLVDSF